MSNIATKIWWTAAGYAEARRAMARQSDPQRIRAIQDIRLQRLVRHCATHIKYYQELFAQAGIRPEQIRAIDDLPRIPLLTKQELRSRFWDFLPRDLPACRVSRTSGSTGVPVCIIADWRSRACNSAAVIRFRRHVGIPSIGRPFLTLTNTDKDPHRPPQWTVLQGVHRQHFLNPYIRTPGNLAYAEHLAAKLGRFILTGITSSVRTLAQGIRDHAFPPLRPVLVTTGGEMLPPETRELIETAFAAPVLDVYACNEARDVAWQCRSRGGYHINADNLIVEIVRDDRPVPIGEVGEVVLTDLNRCVMPIIRYKNGDLARLSGDVCPCGCRLPLMAEIVGRTGENISLPDGRTVLWNQLKGLMNHPHIRQFRLVQERDGDFTIRYISEPGVDTEQLDHLLRRRFKELIGDAVRITLEKTTSLPPDASGKSKLVVSHYHPTANPADAPDAPSAPM